MSKNGSSKRIKNKFGVLLAQKQVLDGRRYTYDDIHKIVGVSPNTLVNYSKQRVTRFDASTMMALCDFLECNLSDLLEYNHE